MILNILLQGNLLKKKEKPNKKDASFVPQFVELLNKSDDVKVLFTYETTLDEMKQSLNQLDKKLQTDLESLRLDYERKRADIEAILAKR